MVILKWKKVKSFVVDSINNYTEIVNFGLLTCPNCHSSNLIRWGVYQRNVIFMENNIAIKKLLTIQRFRCKSCKKTHGVLPEGLIPYKQVSVDVITQLLSDPYSHDLNNILNTSDSFSYETVKRWLKQYKIFEPYLFTMFQTKDKKRIFSNIKSNIIQFYEEFFYRYHKCFMQIKLLSLNMCPL